MNYSASEAVENRVAYNHFEGQLQAQEINQCYIDMLQIVENKTEDDPLYHIIVDVSEVNKMPSDMKVLLPKVGYDLLQHPKSGWFILVSNNQIHSYLASMISQVTKIRFRQVTTKEEALAFLHDVDSTL
jgi:hypothetical protein